MPTEASKFLQALAVPSDAIDGLSKRIAALPRRKQAALSRALRFEVQGGNNVELRKSHEHDLYQFDLSLNRLFAEALRFAHPATTDSQAPSAFVRDPQREQREQDELARNAYSQSGTCLSPSLLHEIHEALAGYTYNAHDASRATASGRELLDLIAQRSRPPGSATTYWLDDQNSAVRDPVLSRLALDPYILSTVGQYFGCAPIHVQTTAWFSFPGDPASADLSASAQLFHQDKEFTRFLKVFIYLSDVDTESGPHCYVEASHIDELVIHGVPFSSRLSDAEIEKIYGRERMREVTGPAGTVLFGDTSAAHKGQPVSKGHRVLLQFEYAASLYLSPVLPFDALPLDETTRPHVTARAMANYDSAARQRMQASLDREAGASTFFRLFARVANRIGRQWHVRAVRRA